MMIFSSKEMKHVLKGKLGKVVKNEIIESSDYFNTHRLTFRIGNHYYVVNYDEGMYEKPFAWVDNVEAKEVAEIIT